VPVGTPFHPRTLELCQSLSYRDWWGYYAVSSYETHHEHEYNAIRNAAALIDVTPLFKYLISGPDATRLVNRVITRDIHRVAAGQVIYCCWCDESGKVIDDGTITRLEENRYRWTAADPSLRWFHQNAVGMRVQIDDVSEALAALALQGPTSGSLLKAVADADVANLKYFRVAHGSIAGVPVDISRTGYTGDLGYELWIPATHALKVWDEIMAAGEAYDLHPAGMLALDVARIEAGLLLMDVDYIGSKKAIIDSQKYSPFELGFDWMVHLDKQAFVGQSALEQEKQQGTRRRLVGLELNWDEIEALHTRLGLPPQPPTTASRVPVPVYLGKAQIGKATSTTWSPLLKRIIALGSLRAEHAAIGSRVEVEFTVEAVRHRVPAKVTKLPFFKPDRKTAVPV
jgi:aminomethyltransferase